VKVQIYKVKDSDSIVSEIVEVKSDSSADTLVHIVPPFNNPEIIFYLGPTHQIKNIPFTKGAIKGIYSTSQKIELIPNYHFITFRLKPYGLRQLFNLNAAILYNSVMNIENYSITAGLSNHLSTTETPDGSFLRRMINSLEQNSIYPVSSVTREFINLSANTTFRTITDLTMQNGIGLRTLQRNFKREVGLSPKDYLKIKRMYGIEQKMSRKADFFDIITDFGFTDQAHFIKDFKQLRNQTPTEILKKKLLLSDQLAIPEIIFI